jgi:ribosomal protein L11 methyltransferase
LTEKRDWVANSLAGLKPVRAGRFLVHGSHDRARVQANDVAIEIEAGLAFGTGHHGTTRGCLLHFDRLLKRHRPAHVLDVGCGAGVLAIAAAKVLKRRISLGDIDSVAVAVANANARVNGVGAFCRAVVSRGVENERLREDAPYDLVFANILARPLRLLAPSLAAVMSADGEAIVSGLLLADVPGVLASWRPQRFHLVERIELEGWASLRLRR